MSNGNDGIPKTTIRFMVIGFVVLMLVPAIVIFGLAYSKEHAGPTNARASGSGTAARKDADGAVAAGSGVYSPPASSSAGAVPTPEPAPGGSVAPVFVGPVETPLDDWNELIGRWVDVEKGDAIPHGMFGGSVVDGGARIEIVKGRAGSKTPWNLVFWRPREGHMDAGTISGGCGFYESGTAYCRGYGLESKKATETSVRFLLAGPERPLTLHVMIAGLLDARVRKP